VRLQRPREWLCKLSGEQKQAVGVENSAMLQHLQLAGTLWHIRKISAACNENMALAIKLLCESVAAAGALASGWRRHQLLHAGEMAPSAASQKTSAEAAKMKMKARTCQHGESAGKAKYKDKHQWRGVYPCKTALCGLLCTRRLEDNLSVACSTAQSEDSVTAYHPAKEISQPETKVEDSAGRKRGELRQTSARG